MMKPKKHWAAYRHGQVVVSCGADKSKARLADKFMDIDCGKCKQVERHRRRQQRERDFEHFRKDRAAGKI